MTLELGGKSANVVFADADLEAAAAAAPVAVFGNAGQDCCARSRILVQEQAIEPFMAALERAVKAMRVGDPLDEDTQMGPLISAGQRDTVASFLDDGEPVAFRGSAPEGAGLLVRPDGARAGRPGSAGGARGGVRADRGGDPLPRRGAGGGAGERHDLRPLGIDLDARRRARAARRPRARDGRAVDQLEQLGARDDPLRGLQAVRLRTRARTARARRLQRGEDDLLFHGGLEE